jgi:hypothetical protein
MRNVVSGTQKAKAVEAGLRRIGSGEDAGNVWTDIGRQYGVSRSTTYHWFSTVQHHPIDQWPEILEPTPSNHTDSKYADCSAEAYEYFKGLCLQGCLREEAYRQTKDKAEQENWVVPSRASLARRLVADGVKLRSRYDLINI